MDIHSDAGLVVSLRSCASSDGSDPYPHWHLGKAADTIERLASDLKAKDAELASLKAENADLIARLERAEKALEQAEGLMREVLSYCVCSACVGDDGRDYPHSGDKAIKAGETWLKERR